MSVGDLLDWAAGLLYTVSFVSAIDVGGSRDGKGCHFAKKERIAHTTTPWTATDVQAMTGDIYSSWYRTMPNIPLKIYHSFRSAKSSMQTGLQNTYLFRTKTADINTKHYTDSEESNSPSMQKPYSFRHTGIQKTGPWLVSNNLFEENVSQTPRPMDRPSAKVPKGKKGTIYGESKVINRQKSHHSHNIVFNTAH